MHLPWILVVPKVTVSISRVHTIKLYMKGKVIFLLKVMASICQSKVREGMQKAKTFAKPHSGSTNITTQVF